MTRANNRLQRTVIRFRFARPLNRSVICLMTFGV